MSFYVKDLLNWIDGRIVNESALGGVDVKTTALSVAVSSIAPLSEAGTSDLAFFFDPAYQADLIKTSAGILITGEKFVKPLEHAGLPLWKKTVVIACRDPYFALAVLSEKFANKMSSVAHTERPNGRVIHPSAVIHESVELGDQVEIGAHVVIEKNCKIGNGTVIYPGCFLGPKVSLGEDCILFSNVSIYEFARLGNRVRLHSGVVIGADGFGYAVKKKENQAVGHQKIYHFGKVVIGDDVEIGANSCIDRATFGETVIGNQVKIDNMVQIGHNCKIGDGTIICGKVGLSGSATIGRFVTIGGSTGINNKVKIGDGAKLGGYSAVVHDVPAGGILWGVPGRLGRDQFRLQILFDRMLKGRLKNKKNQESNIT